MPSTTGDHADGPNNGSASRRRVRRILGATAGRLRRSPGATPERTGASAPRHPSEPAARFAATVRSHRFGDAGAPRQVAVLADAQSPVADWLALFPRGSVTVVTDAPGAPWPLAEHGSAVARVDAPTDIDDALSRLDRVDVVVDLVSGDIATHDLLFRSAFLHLRSQGLYALDCVAGGVGPYTRAGAAWLGSLLGDDDPDEPAPTRPPRELSKAVASLTVTRDLVVAEKRLRHLYKVPESRAVEVLADRDPDLRVTTLGTRPGGVLDMAGSLVSHTAGRQLPFLITRFEYPPLQLRHYEGRIALVSNSLVHTERSLLPDSFRYHRAANQENPRVVSSSLRHGRVPRTLRPTRSLPGSYYLLDSENSGHFGHLMTEVISKLWGWQRAKAEIPDLRAIFRIRFEDERDPVLEKRLFGAFGIAEEDIVWVHEPVWLESLVGATPMWHNQHPHYVHPEITDVWRRISTGLRDPGAPAYDKVFVSRRSGQANRDCHNAVQVDALFAAHGFTVLYPEDHDLAVQAGIFARARVVAGFGGSAMFNVLHADRLETMIVLTSESYTARNELLYAAALGCDLHYFWSEPDIPMPEKAWTKAAYYSSWSFDMDRNAADLTALLDSL